MVCSTCQNTEQGDETVAAERRWQEGFIESQRGQISYKSYSPIENIMRR